MPDKLVVYWYRGPLPRMVVLPISEFGVDDSALKVLLIEGNDFPFIFTEDMEVRWSDEWVGNDRISTVWIERGTTIRMPDLGGRYVSPTPAEDIPFMNLCSDEDDGCIEQIFFYKGEIEKLCPRCGAVVDRREE